MFIRDATSFHLPLAVLELAEPPLPNPTIWKLILP